MRLAPITLNVPFPELRFFYTLGTVSDSTMNIDFSVKSSTLLLLNTLRTGDVDLRLKHGETRYICKFSLVPLHKGEFFQRYHTLKHY